MVSYEERSILFPKGSVICFSIFITMEEVHVKAADIATCFFFVGLEQPKCLHVKTKNKGYTGLNNSRYFCRCFSRLLRGNCLNRRLSVCCTHNGSVLGFKCCDKYRKTAFLLGYSAI